MDWHRQDEPEVNGRQVLKFLAGLFLGVAIIMALLLFGSLGK